MKQIDYPLVEIQTQRRQPVIQTLLSLSFTLYSLQAASHMSLLELYKPRATSIRLRQGGLIRFDTCLYGLVSNQGLVSSPFITKPRYR